MEKFFTRERFGKPQVLALGLLLVFLLQCIWLIQRSVSRINAEEAFRISQGVSQWRHGRIAGTPPGNRTAADSPTAASWFLTDDGFDPYHSPLWYLSTSAGILAWPLPLSLESIVYWGWLARLPNLVFALLLGASLWYVARRLYGNAGGYIALCLYCFSPGILRSSALWFASPEMGAAWGSFGAIFTAIAVAHTLYAPREVVLWNWRRILLLGVSLALASGSQFSLALVAPLALASMLYLAPSRRAAASVIWAVSCLVALFLLLASYFFRVRLFALGLAHADFFSLGWPAFLMPGAWLQMLSNIGQNSPALVIAGPVALAAYIGWRRARYFGNTVPLLVSVLFLLLGIANPHFPGLGFELVAVPFIFLFVSGVAADLLETQQRGLVFACVLGLLIANTSWNLWELGRAALR